MPRTRKETQADNQQTMEQMQEQIAQLTQAMQKLTTQQNNAPAEEREEEDLAGDDGDANPFAVLGRNRARVQNIPNHEEQWQKSFKTEIPEFNGGPTAEELLD